MPEQSSVTSFVTAVKTRQTKTTKRLQHLWDNRTALPPAAVAAINGFLAGTLSYHPALHPDLKDLLQNQAYGPNRLSENEVYHIELWPRKDKEIVQDALNGAAADSKAVGFFWEVYRGKKSRTDVDDSADPNRVTFRSPAANVREDGPTTGNIVVGI